jgi:hypothetical protein
VASPSAFEGGDLNHRDTENTERYGLSRSMLAVSNEAQFRPVGRFVSFVTWGIFEPDSEEPIRMAARSSTPWAFAT